MNAEAREKSAGLLVRTPAAHAAVVELARSFQAIKHPENVIVMKNTLLVTEPETDLVQWASLIHVVAVRRRLLLSLLGWSSCDENERDNTSFDLGRRRRSRRPLPVRHAVPGLQLRDMVRIKDCSGITFAVMGAIPVAVITALFGAFRILQEELVSLRREIVRLQGIEERIRLPESQSTQFKSGSPQTPVQLRLRAHSGRRPIFMSRWRFRRARGMF